MLQKIFLNQFYNYKSYDIDQTVKHTDFVLVDFSYHSKNMRIAHAEVQEEGQQGA